MSGQEFVTKPNMQGLEMLNACIENVENGPSTYVNKGRIVLKGAAIQFYNGSGWTVLADAADLSTLSTTVEGHTTKIANLEKIIGDDSGSTSLVSRVSALETRAGTIEANVETNATAIKTNAATIKANSDAIGTDTTSGTVKYRIASLEGKMTAAEEDIGSLKTAVGDANSGLVKKVADLETSVGTDDTKGLRKAVADNTAAIGTKANSSEVYTKAQVDSEVATLSNRINTNVTAIEGLQNAGYITKDVDSLTNYYKKDETYTQDEVDSKITNAISSSYKTCGSVTATELAEKAATAKNGDVYNVSTAFEIDGVEYPAGTNVVRVVPESGSAYWDALSGLVDLSSYSTTTEVESKISDAISNAGHASKTYVDEEVAKLVPKTTTVNSKALSGNITLGKVDVGLGNVDNTSDLGKPVSTATQNALDAKVDKLSSKPAAATYTKVTINTEGQVTAGTTLDASDIPKISGSKITSGTVGAAYLPIKTYSGTVTFNEAGTQTVNPDVDTILTVQTYKDGALVFCGVSISSGVITLSSDLACTLTVNVIGIQS